MTLQTITESLFKSKTAPVKNGVAGPVKVASTNGNPVFDFPLRKAYGSEEVRVTPEIAQHWLSFNTVNRQVLDHRLIERFKSDMEAGYWRQNGESIKFAYGKLLDGQHRLMALVLAGATVKMAVFHGIDAEAQASMDSGRPRTAKDVVSVEGLGKWDAAIFGTAVHALLAVSAGALPSHAGKFSNREVRNFFLENQSAIESSLRVIGALPRKPTPLPFSRALTMHFMFAKIDRDQADSFFQRLYIGDALAKTSPIFHLRQRLMNDLVTKHKRSAFSECFYIAKAWNAVRKGGAWKGSAMLYPKDGESFPELV